MADAPSGGAGASATVTPNANSNGNAPAGGQSGTNGTNPTDGQQTPPGNGGASQALDINKIFEDEASRKALFEHPRFKSMSERAAKADQLEADAKAAADKALAEQGKYQELSETRGTALEQANATIATMRQDSAIQAAAAQAGITDFDAAAKLIDRTGIAIDKDGNVTGAAEAIKSLVESKPYLVSAKIPPKLGAGGATNPPGGAAPQTFTFSQIKDPVFYRENKAAIDKAVSIPGSIDYSQ